MRAKPQEPYYGDSMDRYVQSIRYPPFELEHMNPRNLPICKAIIENSGMSVTSFTIGSYDEWFVQWRRMEEGEDDLHHLECEISDSPPRFLTDTRVGWFIRPDRLHNISRKLIIPTVTLLILSLFVHAIEPGLVEQGIIGETIAGSISIGPLDYPRLLFYTFPMFILPLVVRTIANFRDFNRQKEISESPYEAPVLSINAKRGAIDINVRKTDAGLKLIRSRVQVGVAMPERSSVLATLDRYEGGQPAPGMSTRLPEKRLASGDETGTGVGESIPMQLSSKKSVILEPLRIMEKGDWTQTSDSTAKFTLKMPSDQWPGSVYSSLIAIHWEVILEFLESNGRRIFWVLPIIMPQSEEPTQILRAPVISGRAELSDL